MLKNLKELSELLNNISISCVYQKLWKKYHLINITKKTLFWIEFFKLGIFLKLKTIKRQTNL